MGELQAHDAARRRSDQMGLANIQCVHHAGDVASQICQIERLGETLQRPGVPPHVEAHHRVMPRQRRHPGSPAVQIAPGGVMEHHRGTLTPGVRKIVHMIVEPVSVQVQGWHSSSA